MKEKKKEKENLNTEEGLKKYWFVILVAVILVGGIIYFAYDQTTGYLPGKQVDGKDVVYTVGDNNITADDFYDDLYENLGVAGVYQFIQRTVVNNAVETTEEMKEDASVSVDTVIAQFKASYAAEYETYLLQAVKAVGYNSIDDLEQYFIDNLKYTQLAKEFLEAGYDESLKPRILSHILIKMEDPDNPTDEEKAKMDAVDAALAEGTEFGTVAYEHSDDSSASDYGSLGYADINTSFVSEFLEASMALNEGETSQWVKTQFGYHLIKCDAATLETLRTYDDFYNGLSTNNPTLIPEGIWNLAKEMNISFSDSSMEEKIMTYLGIDGGND